MLCAHDMVITVTELQDPMALAGGGGAGSNLEIWV